MVNEEAVLNKLEIETRQRNISWSVNSLPFNQPSDERLIGRIYVCPFGNDYLRIYRYEYRYFTDVDEYTWIEEIRLELVDHSGNQKWIFSKNRKIGDIYNLAQYYAENIGSIFDNFLKQ